MDCAESLQARRSAPWSFKVIQGQYRTKEECFLWSVHIKAIMYVCKVTVGQLFWLFVRDIAQFLYSSCFNKQSAWFSVCFYSLATYAGAIDTGRRKRRNTIQVLSMYKLLISEAVRCWSSKYFLNEQHCNMLTLLCRPLRVNQWPTGHVHRHTRAVACRASVAGTSAPLVQSVGHRMCA